MDHENMTFITRNADGEEVECTILFTFASDETGKDYIVYTDNTTDENGLTKVYAATYDPDEDEQMLIPIETEEEWTLIETALQQVQDEILASEDWENGDGEDSPF